MLNIQKLIFNLFQENCYLAWDESASCVIVDPGCSTDAERERLFAAIASRGLTPKAVLLTHAHLDHIFGVRACVDKFGIPVYMDPEEEGSISGFNPSLYVYGYPQAETFEYVPVKDGDVVEFGTAKLRALSTPGHSRGGLCWWCEKENAVFTGDTLFAGSIGRTDNRWADLDTLKSSIKGTLMALEGDVDVYPGHGPATSIGNERLMNPFIVDEFGPMGYQE